MACTNKLCRCRVKICKKPKSKKTSKPVRLTQAQIDKMDIARRSDGASGDWIELYLQEFPPEERRDVEEVKAMLAAGRYVLHETRDKDGTLLTWSMSADYPAAPGKDEPSFWLGCWTVTRRSAQGSGIGRIHFSRLLASLKAEKPGYIGRITEIETTEGLPDDSQPVRRAKFYANLGLKEVDVPYEFPRFQPAKSTKYVPQAALGGGIKGQLLLATFTDDAVRTEAVRSIIRRVYERGYNVDAKDEYIEQRLALIGSDQGSRLKPLMVGGKSKSGAAGSKAVQRDKTA